MTRFPLFSVSPDKFALVCILCVAIVWTATLVRRSPVNTHGAEAKLATNTLPPVPASGAEVSRAGRDAAPAAAPAAAQLAGRFRVKTVVGQPTFDDAANAAGLDPSAAYRVAKALRNKVDFRHDWRESNQVSFVFDTKNGSHPTEPQSVVMPAAVRVSTEDGTHEIFLYKTLSGKAFYYTKNGSRALGGGFLRYPLHFRRISSRFSMHRFDPIKKRWQPHTGVDFAAPTGTPVHATANGVVTFAGVQTGYGNVIEIRNQPPYSTLFAHLSRFAKGIHAGARVRRNEVIGYVGATGWATGPHLHYEVHVDDAPKNPLVVSLPPAKPLHGRELSRFASRSEKLAGLL